MPEKATRCADERAGARRFLRARARARPGCAHGLEHDRLRFHGAASASPRALRHPLNLGRDAGAIRLRKAEGYFGSGQATIPGRVVLDGIDLLRGAFVRMEDYSLDAVARSVLGEGKAVKGDARDRIGEIQHNYRHDLPAFALYARTDARLAYDIVQQARSRAARVRAQPARRHDARSRRGEHRVVRLSSTLSELEKRGIVAPTVRSGDSRVHAAQQGGHVLEPAPGLHRERLGVRLQEPVSEPHPHVQHRSAVVRAEPGARTTT